MPIVRLIRRLWAWLRPAPDPDAGNPCVVAWAFAAGVWRADALELQRACNAAELTAAPGQEAATVAGVVKAAGGPVITEDEADRLCDTLPDICEAVRARQRWLCELAAAYPFHNPWAVPAWQARLLYAELERSRAIAALAESERTGKALDLNTHDRLLCAVYGEEQAENILLRLGRFEEGIPDRLRRN